MLTVYCLLNLLKINLMNFFINLELGIIIPYKNSNNCFFLLTSLLLVSQPMFPCIISEYFYFLSNFVFQTSYVVSPFLNFFAFLQAVFLCFYITSFQWNFQLQPNLLKWVSFDKLFETHSVH